MNRGKNFENYILGLDEYKGADPDKIFQQEEFFNADMGMNLNQYKDKEIRKLFYCWYAAVTHAILNSAEYRKQAGKNESDKLSNR